MVAVWDLITDFFTNMSAWWNWMITPLFDNFKPVDIVGVTGVSVILAFWIAKLVVFWA